MQSTTMFVAACCRWPRTDASRHAVREAALAIDDWGAVKDVVKRHRVSPLVHQAIKDQESVPEEVRDWAKEHAQSLTPYAMRLAQECITIDRLMTATGIEPLHIKGPVLAQLAYGSIAMKFSHDLDIYIEEQEAAEAVACLQQTGYHVVGQTTPVSERQIAAFVRNFKDIGLVGPNGTLVELHWRFLDLASLSVGMEKTRGKQTVAIGGAAELATLDPANLTTYLALHGASHHWYRLKWLADFSAVLNQMSDEARTQVLAQTLNGPAKDACAQALALCDTLFGTAYQPDLSPRAKALYDYALKRIDQPLAASKSFWGDAALLRDIYARRHLFPSIGAAIAEMRTHLIASADVLAWPLPAALNGLYPLVRLPSLLVRRLRG